VATTVAPVITKIATATILVRDQDVARQFYVDKLGFEVRDDAGAADYRWLVVAPPGAETQLYLAKGGPGSLHAGEGIGGQTGIMFECADVRATHAQLVVRGVQFRQPPTELAYGVQAQFEDPDGNIFFLQEAPAPSRTR
jgi:catechol 2,3-dioxygenase-like lactoylglutathione lyase family enzyme